MKSKKNLVLVGMMGSGKSTIGYLLSKKLKLKFLDIDNLIEKEMNMTIKEIFQEKGEKYFRNLEEKITIKYLNLKNSVISLGGGAFNNQIIRNEVIKNNFSFWLNCSNSVLISRIKKNTKRPIANKLNIVKFEELMNKRSKIYSKADFKINCSKLSKNEIITKIIELYENN
tara:strand:- start:155 stop:667 length:513 start_codon:yes stop_codon:yes gene_type:complete